MGCCCGKYDVSKYKLSTAIYDEMVAGLPNMDGKVVAVTGCTTGLGFYCASVAAMKGASKVLLLNRKSQRATVAEADIKELATGKCSVETVYMDLQSFQSVREGAQKVIDIVGPLGGLDVLANNAAVMAMRDVRTNDGYEIQMQTNQLSHVLLTKMLMPQLEQAAQAKGEARVVFHSSSARDAPGVDLSQDFFEKNVPGTLGGDTRSIFIELCTGAGPWTRYHMTKLVNSSFAMALHEQLQQRGSKVKSLACEPGLAATELQATSVNAGLMSDCLALALMDTAAQSAQDGATPLLTCCYSPGVESGDFYAPEGGAKGRPKKTIGCGEPVKPGGEKMTLRNKKKAWDFSLMFMAPQPFFDQ